MSQADKITSINDYAIYVKIDGYDIDGFLHSNDLSFIGSPEEELKKYKKAEEYLKKAVQLMPSDPIVNDHFADILWMNGEKLQARYYWKYVLELEDVEEDLKNKIMKKITLIILFGLFFSKTI